MRVNSVGSNLASLQRTGGLASFMRDMEDWGNGNNGTHPFDALWGRLTEQVHTCTKPRNCRAEDHHVQLTGNNHQSLNWKIQKLRHYPSPEYVWQAPHLGHRRLLLCSPLQNKCINPGSRARFFKFPNISKRSQGIQRRRKTCSN